MQVILVKAAGLVLMICAGYALKRLGVFHTEDANVLSRAIMNFTLPAALIVSFRDFRFETGYLALIALAAAVNLALLLLGLRAAKGRDAGCQTVYGLNVGSYNIGTFVLPLAQSFLPASAVVGVSMFDVGNAPFNLGLSYAVASARGRGERVQIGFVVKRLLRSVPFMTYLIMTAVSLAGLRLPGAVYDVASMVSGANAVLAMLMIGILFELRIERDKRRDVIRILLLRYVCNIAAAAAMWFVPLPLAIRQVAVLSLLAPITTVSVVFCEMGGGDPAVYSVVNPLSILISLVLTFLALPVIL